MTGRSTLYKIFFVIVLLVCAAGRRAHAAQGSAALRDFAIVESPPGESLRIRYGVRVNGSICAPMVTVRPWAVLTGDVVALNAAEIAVKFARGDRVIGDVITGGGSIVKPTYTAISGTMDTSGQAPEFGDCSAATNALAATQMELSGLAGTLSLPAVAIPREGTQRVPDSGTLGAGQVVIDTPQMDLAGNAEFLLVGGPSTTQVIVRTAGIKMRFGAHLALDGLQPEQVLYVVEDTVSLYEFNMIAGSLMGNHIKWRGRSGRSQVDGALLARSNLSVGPFAIINLHPFAGF